MSFVQHDDVVETLSSKRPHNPLGNGVRLRCPKRRHDRLDANGTRATNECLSEARISIPDNVAGLATPRRGLNHLPPRPLCGCMPSHIEVDDSATPVLDEEEHVQRLERQGVDGEEVTSPDLRSVISKERSPSLRWRPSTSLMSIATNGLGANVEAQGKELATNSFRAPMRVLLGHARISSRSSAEIRGLPGVRWWLLNDQYRFQAR